MADELPRAPSRLGSWVLGPQLDPSWVPLVTPVPVQVPGSRAVVTPMVLEHVFNAGAWPGCSMPCCVAGARHLSKQRGALPPGSPPPGTAGTEGSLLLCPLDLVVAAPLLNSLRREKFIFTWGLPFRCHLSYPIEQETDKA